MLTPTLVPNHRLPWKSSRMHMIKSSHKPSFWVKCVKVPPSYMLTPLPQVPNQRLPWLSFWMDETYDELIPWSTSRYFIYTFVLSFKGGDKALTGCGCMQSTTFPSADMGTPVGTVSPVELNNPNEVVSTPGVKVLRESLLTEMIVRDSGILCTF